VLHCDKVSLAELNMLLPEHFQTVWSGNPYQPMDIIIDSATLDGTDLYIGDEIAIFDTTGTGDYICVGAGILTDTISSSTSLTIVASADNPLTDEKDGFADGNEIIYRFWDRSESIEIINIDALYPSRNDENFTSNGSAEVTLDGIIDTWTGSDDNDWHTDANWNHGSVPGSISTVVVPAGLTNYPTISSPGSCNNILLKADATGVSSILGNDQLTITETAILQSNITSDKWHIISSPIDNQITEFYYLNGKPKVFIIEFDEPTNSYQYITDLTIPIETMQGYMLWINDIDQKYNYTGTLNSGTFGSADNLTRSNEGWNMVGNPYPSSLDWEATTGWTKTNVDNAIYIINDGNWASYVSGIGTNGGTQYVAPGQGFFVRVSNGNNSGTLQMTDDVRVHNNTTFFKSTNEISNYLKLVVFNDNSSDETVIRFHSQTTTGFDREYDAVKKFAFEDHIPQIYSTSDVEYSINTLPEAEFINLGFQAGVSGEFTISLSEIDNIGQVRLLDKLAIVTIDLLAEDYTFSHDPAFDPDRFELQFGPVGTAKQPQTDILIYSYRKTVFIKSTGTLNGIATVYTIMGQELFSTPVNDKQASFQIDKAGYYLVRFENSNQSITRKLVVN
jgi:hypothetical protein